jgi:serine O-acetyltransferase
MMINLFKMDAARWVVPEQIADVNSLGWPTILKLLFRHVPLRAMFWFRLGSWLKQKRIPYFPGALQRFLLFRFGLELPVGGDIGGGFYVAHPVGCVLYIKSIGENCTVIANVTVGMRTEWAFPELGDRVFLGAGARVLGDIRIGDEAIIGANAVVIKPLPDGATAVGVPARVIKINPKFQPADAPEMAA